MEHISCSFNATGLQLWPRLPPNEIDFPLQLSLNEVNRIDVAFDGADEVDSQMNLIKVRLSKLFAQGCILRLDGKAIVKELSHPLLYFVE